MRIFQAWGMTETSPVATYSRPEEHARARRRLLGRARQAGQCRCRGWSQRWSATTATRSRGTGSPPARSRCAGPWIAGALLRRRLRRGQSSTPAGCAPATSPRWTRARFVQITDRSKDVIKSGGEWISSVELENEVMAHPDVIEAAVIAKPDERWAERPLCCVVHARGRRRRARRSSSSTCAGASPSGGCPTSSRSSRRSPRRASASSTRRSCASAGAGDAGGARACLRQGAAGKWRTQTRDGVCQ